MDKRLCLTNSTRGHPREVAHAREQSGSKYHASQSSPLRPPVFMLAALVGPRRRLRSGRRAVEERRLVDAAAVLRALRGR